MLKRISQILSTKNLTSAKFADEIGVQRSSISHVLSGRNKPSLEFIQKILKTYTDIDTNWLLLGKGDILAKSTISNNKIHFPEDTTTIHSEDIHAYKKAERTPKSPKKRVNNDFLENESENNQLKQKKMEKIIVLYRDNSFKEYYPE
ncbi:MAG: helix-turn-helix domain-containing protein [Bacteroidales bacterium]|nr:helix-turn-helix domain-containing protein [Bacteroidales bacterium]